MPRFVRIPRRPHVIAAVLALVIGCAAIAGATPGRAATAQPDLRITSVSAKARGASSRVNFVIVNGGQARAPASQVSFRYSRSRLSASAGVRLVAKRVDVQALRPGGRVTYYVTIRPPRGSRNRFLFACADAGSRVRESSELNNCRRAGTREQQVQAPPPPAPMPTAPAGDVQPAPVQPVRNFAGTLTTTIRYLNFCGTPAFDETTSIPSTITIGPPVSAAPLSPDLPPAAGGDSNPIRISLGQQTVAASIARGSIFLNTAQRYGATSPGLVLQYFRLAFDGTNVTGTLVEDYREQAAAVNLLANTTQLVPCRPELGAYDNQSAIAEGTTLRGTISDQAVRLRIEGNITDTTRPFVAELTAGRVS